MKLIVVDCETGGLDPAHHALIEFAAVLWVDYGTTFGATGAEFHCVVDEKKPDTVRGRGFVRDGLSTLDPEALKINGWTEERITAEGVSPRDAVLRFERWLGSVLAPGEAAVLAGSNVSFDVAFLRRLYWVAGCDDTFDASFSHRKFDTASVLKYLHLIGKLPEEINGLTAAVKHFEIDEQPRHTALGDARMAADLITRLVELGREN